MGAGVSERKIKYHLRKMANKYPGIEFRVLRASNGETAILPVDPQTNEVTLVSPQALYKTVTLTCDRCHGTIKPSEANNLQCPCGGNLQ